MRTTICDFKDLGLRINALGFGLGIYGIGFWVNGLGLRVHGILDLGFALYDLG